MRSSLLSSLGAVLSLGVSGALANVVCDTTLGERANSANTAVQNAASPSLAEETKTCIEQACAAREAGQFLSRPCGPVVLAITHVDSALPDVAACVSHFTSIVDQCIVTGRVQTGTSVTDDAVYEIYVPTEEGNIQQRGVDVDDDDLDYEDFLAERDDEDEDEDEGEEDDDDDDDDSSLQSRGIEKRARSKGASRTSSRTKSRTKTRPKTKPKTKKTKAKKTKAKKAKKTKTKGKKKTKAKAKGKKKQQACKNPNAKSKGKKGTTKTKTGKKPKKTVRDVIDGYLPQLFRRTSPHGSSSSRSSGSSHSSSSSGQACAQPDVTPWYKVQQLHAQVKHWRFKTREGWQHEITERRVLDVMRQMHRKGKLDVIQMKRAHTSIIGEPDGRTDPHRERARSGSYMLVNGGFFIMGGATNMRFDVNGQTLDARQYSHYSVGRTTSTQLAVPIPPSQEHHYRKLQGDDGSYLYSGPTIKSRLDLNSPELKYRDSSGHSSAYTRIPGGVATSDQPNERVVTVTLSNGDKYFGVNIRSAHAAINLDGGGSIYLSWNHGRREYVIAGGNLNGQTPATIASPRIVTNMVRFDV
ncbi:hypothetical protein N0V90_012495 [Kalmusia sp. IMI 367209]|nr:hypothetical protein N0V90_012495 [Kalmusia sp. IMI 367209]